uniref:SPRY-associated domain-containing protein n=1 Tax=Knipowitschia caucasica TaxID=637954 RepID=A0AAV2MLP1_KNICA
MRGGSTGAAQTRRELDLSYNHPGASAEVLTAVRDHPHYPLHTLRLDPAGERWMVTGPRKYFCDVSLDPNTANNTLQLSEDRRTVTRVKALQLYPSHQDRFSSCPQLLSSTALTGHSYFEVEWSGDVAIALSHRGIGRRGDLDQCRFGDNDQSWSLRIEGDGRSFWGERVSGHVCTSALPVHCYILGIMEPLSPGADLGPDLSSLCLSEETSARRKVEKSGSQTRPGPSCESLKSDRSKPLSINFKRDSNPHPALSCGSSLSDSSEDWLEEFKNSPPENMGKNQKLQLRVRQLGHVTSPSPETKGCSQSQSSTLKRTLTNHCLVKSP